MEWKSIRGALFNVKLGRASVSGLNLGDVKTILYFQTEFKIELQITDSGIDRLNNLELSRLAVSTM